MKKFLYALLIVILSCSIVYGADKSEYFAADELYVMGLFSGVGNDQYGNPIYDLDAKPTREQAITVLVRLLGKEEEALSHEWETPFKDLSDWAKPYVGYAYCNGLTAGVSSTLFGSKDVVNELQYDTFLLRALKYEDDKDFTWDKSDVLTKQLGISSEKSAIFTRGKLVLESVKALDTNIKGQGITLLDTIPSVTAEKKWHRENAQRASLNIDRAAKMYANAKDKPVSRYSIPAELGKQTLFFDEAEALVGRAPIIVQRRVQNIADVLQYSIAAGFRGGVDVFSPWYGSNYDWGYDWSGEVQLTHNWFTCCAGATNYTSYLLQGDYDDQGWIQYLGGGNHHFNWVKENGKYYIFDLTQYANSGDYTYADKQIIVADSLQDFVDNKWPSYYASKSEINQIYAAIDDGPGSPGNFESNVLKYPKSLEGRMTMLYAAPGYKTTFTFQDPTCKLPGYNCYEYVQPRNNDRISKLIEQSENSALGIGQNLSIRYDNEGGWKNKIFDQNNSGFGATNATLSVLYKGKPVKDFTFTQDNNIGKIKKTEDGRLFLCENDTDIDIKVTVYYNGESFMFRWVGLKNCR